MSENYIEQFIEQVDKSAREAQKAAEPPTAPDGKPLIGKVSNTALGIAVEVTGDRSIQSLTLTGPAQKLSGPQLANAIVQTVKIANRNYDKLAQGDGQAEAAQRQPKQPPAQKIPSAYEPEEDDEDSGFNPNDPLGRNKQQWW